jgi:hypothetical protein
MQEQKRPKPAALVSLSDEEYEGVELLDPKAIEDAFAKGRDARRAVEAETPQPVISARVRFQ